jgi:hypothetical protein
LTNYRICPNQAGFSHHIRISIAEFRGEWVCGGLRWAGHILRLEESSLIRKVLIAVAAREIESGCKDGGGLLAAAPAFGSVEQLLEVAGDRDEWREGVIGLLPATDPSVQQWERRQSKLDKEVARLYEAQMEKDLVFRG